VATRSKPNGGVRIAERRRDEQIGERVCKMPSAPPEIRAKLSRGHRKHEPSEVRKQYDAGLQNVTDFDTLRPPRWIEMLAPKIVSATPAPASRRPHGNAPFFFGPDPYPQFNTASAVQITVSSFIEVFAKTTRVAPALIIATPLTIIAFPSKWPQPRA
jgi:hypothetical protein